MDLLALLFAFCGGAFGASIGALASFIFVGITGILGVIAAMSGAQFNWIGLFPFGSVFGPHICFVGGVTAAAFARKMNYIESGKDIAKALVSLKRPVVLVVGGIFGMLGYFLNYVLTLVMSGKIDTVAFTVFLVSMLAKIAFGNNGFREIFGTVPRDVEIAGGRYSMHSNVVWIPYMTTAAEKTIVAISAGGLSAYVTSEMLKFPETAGVAVLVGFFISAISLIWLHFGTQIPVTHHITLCAAYGVALSGGSILWGLAAAVLAAFMGDFLAKTFHLYGECHIDPPAMAITAVSFILMGIIPLTEIYKTEPTVVPVIIIALAVVYSFIQSLTLVNSVDKKEITSTLSVNEVGKK
jgi:hypothetical protein